MLKLFRITFIVCFFCTSTSFSQSFSGIGGPIPDNGQTVDFTINVSGLPTVIDTINYGLETVCLNITHTWDSDLDISLIAPDGTIVTLASGVGESYDDFTGTCFLSSAAVSIIQGTAPFTGNYRPQGQLGMVNNGQDPNGVWTLRIVDTYPADAGILLNWSIEFTNSPATVFSFESSNLPLVFIQTSGQLITDEPKITAWMGIVDNGPGVRNYTIDTPNNYDGFIGIELRGQSSLGFPQKQYSIETRDSLGNNLDAAILGMPAENDWVLYAPYNDKSLLRNSLTYSLARDMGRYASRERYCELILNGEYKGVYTFFEKVKRDANRVDISKLAPDDTTGNDVTGGYICSIDWIDNGGWYSNYPSDLTNPNNGTVYYQYNYPQDTLMHPAQQQYIQQFVDSFETALLSTSFSDPLIGWRKYADEGSFIDFFLMNELSKNVDGYRLSTFFYKEKITQGGKINMGPVWDFNLAWHNANYCNNQNVGGWAYLITNYCQWDFPFWWRRLDEDTTFQNNVRCRWEELRTTVFDTAHIYNYIDSIAGLLDESQQRHYFIYPLLGIYTWPNPNPLATTYQGEIDNLKLWIQLRINYMDAQLPGTCLTSGLTNNETLNYFQITPNPAADFISVVLKEFEPADIVLYNNTGQKVLVQKTSSLNNIIDVSVLPKGVYFIRIESVGFSGEGIKFLKM